MTGTKKALVTGGSRGLGREIVAVLKNYKLEVFAPSRDELELSCSDSIEKFINVNRSSGFSVLVNNAGINFPETLVDSSEELWKQTLQVNLSAPRQLLKGFLPSMRESNYGRIINISSIFAIVSKAKRSTYTAAKSGLDGLTRAIAVEYGEYGILINSVCPGFLDTELTRKNNSPEEIKKIKELIPLKRLADPKEVAQFVGFLCSDKNTYITGQSLIVDGGFTIL
ncbi:MAG: SDR family NAD(P)-dependent oxidoreductase [Pseudomonadota bacterium]